MSHSSKPLEGIKVVDLTYYVAGPGSAKFLSDWGADVIKVEPPAGEPGRMTGVTLGVPSEDDFNPYFGTYNANKKAIALNLKSEKGMAVMEKLLSEANVFVTSFRPGALKRLGLDYESVSKKFPKIVWASINGFGEVGPDKDKAGFDTVAFWAKSGAMIDLTEKDTSPINPTLAFGDASTSCSLAGGICAALLKQARTGEGSKVMVSLFSQAIWQLGSVLVSSQYGDVYPKTRKCPNGPLVNSYQTKDGEWLFVCVLDDRMYRPFLESALSRPDLADDARYNNAVGAKEHTVEMTAWIAAEFAKYTIDEMVERLTKADIAFERINHVADVLQDPQARANNYIVEVAQKNGQKTLTALTPVRIGTESEDIVYDNPRIGEHTAEILKNLGYSDAEIAELENEKVIRTAN